MKLWWIHGNGSKRMYSIMSDTSNSKNDDLVSIVLATYNGSSTLPEAVRSIYEQSYKNWELIIIDDCSSDDVHKALDDYANDPRIKLYRNEKNIGLARSLNRAMELSTGKYIARMDDDDFSEKERIEKQLDFMSKNPDIDVLGSGATLVDSNLEYIGVKLMPERHEEIKRDIYKYSPLIHPTVMMRRSFVTRHGGYNENMRRKEDYELWGRTILLARFHNLQDPLIKYRVKKSKSIKAIPPGVLVRIKIGLSMGCFFKSLYWASIYASVSLLRHVGYVQKAHRK